MTHKNNIFYGKKKILRWSRLFSTSILDQFFISVSTFILNIFLARYTSAEDYGSFAISFSIFLFIGGFHNSLLLEPMSVIGPKYYKKDLASYVNTTVQIYLLFSILLFLSLIFLTIVLIYFKAKFGTSLLGLSVSSPFIFLFWQLRRACYIEMNPMHATRAGLLYFICFISLLLFTRQFLFLNSIIAYLILGFSSLSASILLIKLLHIKIYKIVPIESLLAVIKQHWVYGQWLVASSVFYWFGTAIFLPLVGIFLSYKDAGAYRAMQNFIMPVNQIFVSVSLLLLPWTVTCISEFSIKQIKNSFSLMIFGFTMIAFFYSVIILVFAKYFVLVLYNGKYQEYIWILPYMCITLFITAFAQPVSIMIRSLERPRAIFIAQFFSAVFTITVGTLLTWKFKLLGALYGANFSILVYSIILLKYFNFYVVLSRRNK